MATTLLKPSRLLWFALVLLVLSVGINYLDRGNLSVALYNIEHEFHLNKDQLGLLGTAFFVSYALLQIGAGPIIDRFNVHWEWQLPCNGSTIGGDGDGCRNQPDDAVMGAIGLGGLSATTSPETTGYLHVLVQNRQFTWSSTA